MLELQPVVEKIPCIFPGSGRHIEVPDDGRSTILTSFVARKSRQRIPIYSGSS